MYSCLSRQFYPATTIFNRTCIANRTAVPIIAQLRNSTNLTPWSVRQSHMIPPFTVCQSRLMSSNSQTKPQTVVYSGSMSTKVLRVKVFSFGTTLIGLAIQPTIVKESSSLPILIGLSSILGFFTFVTPILLHIVSKKYVFQILYDEVEDSYHAELITFFCRKRRVTFKPGEAKIPDVAGMFTNLEVKGIPMMVDFSSMNVHHCKHILGYDKPLDIKHESIVQDLALAEKLKSNQ